MDAMLGRVVRPVGLDPVGVDEQAVQHQVVQPVPPGHAQCPVEFGGWADSGITVFCTYRQAVVVETPKPAAISVNVSPLRRWTSTSRTC